MLGSVLVAGGDIDIEDKPRARHRIGIRGMPRPPWLLGIVANNRAFPTTVKQLHGRIDVEDRRLGDPAIVFTRGCSPTG